MSQLWLCRLAVRGLILLAASSATLPTPACCAILAASHWEWLPGGCRLLSKKALKAAICLILESAGCKSVLSAGWVLLWGGSPINKAHPPLRCYAVEKKPHHELVILLSDRINGITKVQQAITTTSLWPWQPSWREKALQVLLSKCRLVKDRQRESVKKSAHNAAVDSFHSTASAGWMTNKVTHTNTHTRTDTTDDLNFTPCWNIPSAELFPRWQILYMPTDVTHQWFFKKLPNNFFLICKKTKINPFCCFTVNSRHMPSFLILI